VETVKRTPSTSGGAIYFWAITALTVRYGDVVSMSTFDRIDAILLGMLGMVFKGLIVAAAVGGAGSRAAGESSEFPEGARLAGRLSGFACASYTSPNNIKPFT
jgi:voltage-gated potassium channel